MPELRCEHCGTQVLVRGLAAVCPNCKELVTPPPPSMLNAAANSDSTALGVQGLGHPIDASQQQRSPASSLSSSTIQLPPVSPAPSEMDSPPLPSQPAPQPHSKWKVIVAAVLVVGLALMMIDYVRLRLRPPPQPVVAVQPPAPANAAASPRPPDATSRGPFESSTVVGSLPAAEAPKAPTQRDAPALTPQAAADDSAQIPEAAQPRIESPPPPPRVEHPFAFLANVKPSLPDDKVPERITDEEIGAAIQRGVDFLLAQFSATRLKDADRYDAETFAGLNALCVYALLHAGQAISDPRLSIQNDTMKSLIARMKEFPMEGNRATYSRALRISALAVHDRPEDRTTLEKDAQWLLRTSMQGAYTYGQPPEGASRATGGWDNSNAQYGALGVWAATEAGFRAPASYWGDVQAHWAQSQTHSGGWGYGPGATSATLAMTSAGVTSLFIAREQLGTQPGAVEAGPLTPAILRGLEWLDEGDNSVNVHGGHKGYTLYGLERAGLASGYKFFGKHDWYLELAARAIAEQRPDGSWEGGDGVPAETAFTLLFLSRGRHPIFVSKLRFEGNWANRPRDIANLTRFAGRELERPLNWQTVGTERGWTEWTDSPVLFITSDQPPNFSDSEIAKLRAYAEAGGLIFMHAERSSPAFNRSVEALATKLFPQYAYRPIPPEHVIHSVMFQVEKRPELWGVSNGTRLLLVHSPGDLSRAWTIRPIRSNRPSFESAVNVIVYAAGRREFRNRLNSIYVSPSQDSPSATVPLARLRYNGNWDPEPGAWQRFARVLQRQTGLTVSPITVPVAELIYETAPIAHLTGTEALALDQAQVDALRQYVARGGVLLIDACGGSQSFHKSIQADLLPALFPASVAEPLPESHPVLAGRGDAMSDITKPRFRPYAVETRGLRAGQLSGFEAGKGVVIISDLDVASGLLGTGTWGIAGYQPAYSEALMKNLVLWTIERVRREVRRS